jgi:hypothetical protein
MESGSGIFTLSLEKKPFSLPRLATAFGEADCLRAQAGYKQQ